MVLGWSELSFNLSGAAQRSNPAKPPEPENPACQIETHRFNEKKTILSAQIVLSDSVFHLVTCGLFSKLVDIFRLFF
jgi:hypothetical protein